ncbi:autophagy protein 17 [Bachmanniomyces sp. S44760]|nr:autophagy protein 17 [Bachmanniomyces sp. S44760]
MSSTSSLPAQSEEISLPSLDDLVSHLLAAKRSLSSINHVYRANELTTATRKDLESHTIVGARTAFLQIGIGSQSELLKHVQVNIESVRREGNVEFQAVLKDLDVAEARLRSTLNQMKETFVERDLRPDEEEQKTLTDFVDEAGVKGIMGTIKEGIDATGTARKEFETSNARLDEDIAGVTRLLGESDHPGSKNSPRSSGSPIPEALQRMEEHAKAMADNLESLVKHYDLCVTAVRSTEGGGAAAQQVTGDLPEGIDADLGSNDAPVGSMSEEERKDMLEVLERDASEVDDVVMEIRDHNLEMEAQYELVTAHTERVTIRYANTLEAFRLLEDIGYRLPGYINQSHVFIMRWDEEKAKIQERMEELDGLCDFYDGFLRGYDSLIIEIGRRKHVEAKVQKVLQEAMLKVDKLYEEDVAARDDFKQEHGDFLPVDIWPGLMAPLLRYEVAPLQGDGFQIPDISKSTIQRAIRRVSGRA